MNAPVLMPDLAAAMAGNAAQDDLHGLVRVGAMEIAFPIAQIREVVPHPDRLRATPRTMPALQGAMDLRGAIVPVLDLTMLMGMQADGEVGQHPDIIMVLRTSDGVFGVGIDEICGVVDLGHQRMTPMSHVSGDGMAAVGQVIRAGFTLNGHSGVVLDAQAFVGLPGLALAEDRLVSAAAHSAGGEPTLIFSIGPYRFGLAAKVIDASVPQVVATPSPVDDSLWIGLINHNGRRLPVVDTLNLLGFDQMAPAREMASVVLRLEDGGLIALRIDRVHDMARIRREDWLTLQGMTIGQRGLLGGAYPGDQTILMLDPAKLAADATLQNLARLEEGNRVSAAAEAIGQGRKAYLIITLGEGAHAVPLEEVDEVLTASLVERIPLAGEAGCVIGLMPHRGAAVPLVDLGSRLGVGSTRHGPFILLASSEGRRMGFMIDALSAVERVVPRELAQAGAGSAGRFAPSGLPGATILTQEGKTCSILNLADLIDAQP
ncbi:chemotaxis protein CheW [Novosphingobium umbonatum]|uniref:Chemotaxis protein CheW n=1 Tax=Novosphingobium umbonatum TaxID=1908524 RepID=A0A437N8V1_9SPHN|nr:chemotaxis protein CheW [Novosphingobium umbonatum]RVU06338.1 chemotaxis protein CheW [Novosphingobium umbonatum]